MTERARGRPPSGRKVIVQIGLDEEDFETLQALAIKEGESTSSKGRKLLEGALARDRTKRR